MAAALQGALPVIGVGDILNGADAVEKMQAGAALVQVYSELIYRGTDLVAECAAVRDTAELSPAQRFQQG